MQLGDYAYRFSGHAMQKGSSHYLVGVGTITLKAENVITGHQRTAITRLQGHDSKLVIGYWSLEGTHSLTDGGYSEHDNKAGITFTQLNKTLPGRPQILEATFNFVPVSQKKFWIIGTGGKLLSSDGKLANESVSGEAELIA